MLIPSIIQNCNKKVTMLAWSNKKSISLLKKIGYMSFYSRKRKEIWIKGEKSTNFQIVKKYFFDCDKDSVLFVVNQVNNISCHKNKKTCFFKKC